MNANPFRNTAEAHRPDRTLLEEAWEAMADQFLDTETRTWLPRAAMACLEAGLSPEAAFDAWAYDVTPAVWQNLWDIAGEWGGWNRAWLVARIERERTHRSPCAYLVYRARVGAVHGHGLALLQCMARLGAEPPAARARLADDLTWLAAHFFDFLGKPALPSELGRLRRVCDEAFLTIFAPLAVDRAERSAGEARLARALGPA